jgi:hypothetical protein
MIEKVKEGTRIQRDTTHSILVQGDTVGTIGQASSSLSELAEAHDGKVLLVELTSMNNVLSLTRNVKTY